MNAEQQDPQHSDDAMVGIGLLAAIVNNAGGIATPVPAGHGAPDRLVVNVTVEGEARIYRFVVLDWTAP